MVSASNQDLTLKLRFSRILFCQGYWSPIEVELSQFEITPAEVKRRSLTDLDVLGIKFDELFTVHKVVGDCKSGKSVSDVNRLFWLRGVMDYFGADQAYFLRNRIDSHARAIAPKMGLRVLSEAELESLEKSLNVGAIPLPLADVGVHTHVTSLWGLGLQKGEKPSAEDVLLKELYSYLSYSYWYVDPHRNPFMLISHFERAAHLLKPTDPKHILLAHVGAERFACSLLDIASHVQAQGAADIPRHARIYLYGGPLALKEKEEFFKLLNKATGAQERLDIPALKDILELVGRMVRNPSGASDILRHLNAIYLWRVHLGKDSLPALSPNGQNTAAIVLAKDVATTFARATGISESFFEAMQPL